MGTETIDQQVRAFTITQATTKIFRDLYVNQTMIVLVQAGSKQVRQSNQSSFEVFPGQLLIFPSGSFITIENRIISGGDYVAFCLSYPDSYLKDVFSSSFDDVRSRSAVYLNHCPPGLATSLKQVAHIAEDNAIPDQVRHHRLLEPLVWLHTLNIVLRPPLEKSLECRLRDVIAADPARRWRSPEMAAHLGYSEATLRRRLQAAGTTFSHILKHVRLEHGLALLQTTHLPISQIALDCGFATPSHFSDSFRARFQIPPKSIRQALQ